MKHLKFLAFACICLALSTCENPQLITLLKAPSELVSLEIVAYAGDAQLEGGAAMEPGFTTSVFNYTVYVSKDTDRFLVSASIDGNGTIEIMCEENQETGTEHDFLDEESKVMILTVEREYMEIAEYRVTVVREDVVPTARGVEISVTSRIGAFFIGRGVLPELKVTAKVPAAGGELSYQWYINYENSNRGGTRINGATGDTYKMRPTETMNAQTVYYYAEIFNTIDGKTGVTESSPCRVTFSDKNKLHEKSRAQDYMVNIPAGEVTAEKVSIPGEWSTITYWNNNIVSHLPWSTPGFSMGQYPVTWELWKTVFDYAEAANYSFANVGNQGAKTMINSDNFAIGGSGTNMNPQPVGNSLNPVTSISWRDAVVWCNAYSEMNGLEPVYRDSDGNVFRDSRLAIDLLVDADNMDWNGYRLPTAEEWEYARRGANPSTSPPWTDRWVGTDIVSEAGEYLWSFSYEAPVPGGIVQTGVVGSRNPDSLGLYDMMGMVWQWVWFEWDDSNVSNSPTSLYAYNTVGAGTDFASLDVSFFTDGGSYTFQFVTPGQRHLELHPFRLQVRLDSYYGLRLARNKE